MEKVLGRFNCIGYAYFRLGLQDKDVYLWPNSVKEIAEDFEETDFKEAQAIIVTAGECDQEFIHLAALDTADRHFVFHRRGCGEKVTHDPLVNIFSEYKGSEYNFLFLKVKRKDY